MIEHLSLDNNRKCLRALYMLSFFTLLRVDEVLEIQSQNISWDMDTDGTPLSLRLTLPFRKTDQSGGGYLQLYSRW